MIMQEETIVTLYNEAYENGDPAAQIKSLAKANGVRAAAIKKILRKAGCDVPCYIPRGPLGAVNEFITIEPADPVQGEENIVLRRNCAEDGMIEDSETKEPVKPRAALPIPDAVKRALAKELDAIETQIKTEEGYIKRLEAEYETIAKYLQSN